MRRSEIIVFIAGPYRGTLLQRMYRIWTARQYANDVWRAGYCVICPHMNSALMRENTGDFLYAYRELLRRSDIVYALRNWTKSVGTRKELELAQQLDKPIAYSFDQVVEYGEIINMIRAGQDAKDRATNNNVIKLHDIIRATKASHPIKDEPGGEDPKGKG